MTFTPDKFHKYTRYARRVLRGYFQSVACVDANQSLHLLMLGDSMGRILRAQTGRSQFQTAYVGNSSLINSNTEALMDSGFVGGVFFEGSRFDRFHPYHSLDELKPEQFDVILLGDDDETLEASLLQALSSRHDIQASGLRIISLRRLYAAHIWALNQMKFGRAFSCLNIRKLSIIACGIYLSPQNGCVVEVGCYRGGTTIYMAKLQRYLGYRRQIYACDTFEGMPEAAAQDKGGSFVYTSGMFTDNPEKNVAGYFKSHAVSKDISIRRGLVQDSLPSIMKNETCVAFAFADTDQYAGTRASFESVAPFFSPDSIMIIDDTTCAGVQKAIQEALRQNPDYLHAKLSGNFDMVQTTRKSLAPPGPLNPEVQNPNGLPA